jgi:hypothetical protein
MVAGGVFLLNIVRLEFGFVAMTRGEPWWLAHECVAGVAYFCLFVFIVRERAWSMPSTLSADPEAKMMLAERDRQIPNPTCVLVAGSHFSRKTREKWGTLGGLLGPAGASRDAPFSKG